MTAAQHRDPIDRITWVDAQTLSANDYNPNVVFSPELRLLERNILLTGWVQPVLANASDGNAIIDGFHRVMLSRESKPIRARYQGQVPCAFLELSRPDAMMLTIRMNRAKGTHVALKMSAIIHELLAVHHCDRQEIAQGIGATLEEIDLLAQDGVFTAKGIPDHAYSRAWYPANG